MKRTLFLGLILLAAIGLFAQPYAVTVRFVDEITGLDVPDVSEVGFEVELLNFPGDIQTGPNPPVCIVGYGDVGAGMDNSYILFDLANFANPYLPTCDVRVTIWNGVGDPATVVYAFPDDMSATMGMMGWGPFFGGAGGDPVPVPPNEPPVPVTLSDFATAVFENEFVQINWTTQSASNMNLWNLYREDVIIHTEAAVNGTEPHTYIYEDTDVMVGETYTYYLEAVDNDGSTTMFGPVSATFTGEEIPELPTETELFGNYPNPFNPVTEIKFNVKEGETAKLTIFDVKGRTVANSTYPAGAHSYIWEANSSASGVYFYKLESQSTTSVKKMMLLK